MSDYDFFAKYYDSAMGNKIEEASIIESWIKKYGPKFTRVLDLACGTGTFAQYFFEHGYEVTGIDLSEKMIDVARQKVPKANFIQQDMTVLSLPIKFDVILCLFDSINHIVSYPKWEQLFINVHTHLNDGGLLIFDVNTEKKLNDLTKIDEIVREDSSQIVTMKVINNNDVYNWKIKITEKISNDEVKIYEGNIEEKSYPLVKIEASLMKVFRNVNAVTISGGRGTEDSSRVYFIAQK